MCSNGTRIARRVNAMRVYIAGPMSGLPDYNFPAFFIAEERWKVAGHHVYNPARSDEAFCYTSFGLQERRHVIVGDVLTISHHADAIALLPGWEASRGATVEVALAQYLDLPIYDADTMKQIYPCLRPWGELQAKTEPTALVSLLNS